MNLRLAYRPLKGGVGIVPSTTRRWATLGLIAEGSGRRWIVTAAHAVGPIAADGALAIHQGPWKEAGHDICNVAGSDILVAPALDVAAVPITVPGVTCVPEIADLGRWTGIEKAEAGQRVVKVGAGSGFTAGVVASAAGGVVTIAPAPGCPAGYRIAESGDSGAAWLAWPTLRLTALHRAVSSAGNAIAADIDDALTAMSLTPL